MMTYTVVLTENARREIDQSYYWGCDHWGKAQAKKWYRGLMKAILDLEHFPERQPLAPESDEIGTPIRQLIYGRYRILFKVEQDTVEVLYCRGAYTN
ncbi:MAG: type II toxin-antitoxin system RelE/ParE family toxin [Acidobacteriota bacterium]